MLSRGTSRSISGTVPCATSILQHASLQIAPLRTPASAPRWRASQQCRGNAIKAGKTSLRETTLIAEQLGATGLWNYGRWASKTKEEAPLEEPELPKKRRGRLKMEDEPPAPEPPKKRGRGRPRKVVEDEPPLEPEPPKTRRGRQQVAEIEAPAAPPLPNKTGAKKAKGDKYRVNIVSEALVDDVLAYMSPELVGRHKGCDLLDIYPGAGLWSHKLHDLLQPRSHVLLEPDEALYAPFLQPLLDRPNVSLVPKSGIIWRELSDVLDSKFQQQQERQAAEQRQGSLGSDGDAPPRRNDTLLVTANLAFFPKRGYASFDSLTQLVIFQFISAIRASSLFHRYGLVRMLLWVEASDRNALLAKSCQRRRRLAIEGELATDWITEVAGPDDFSKWFVRDGHLDRASCQQTLERMAAAGLTIPEGRATSMAQQVLDAQKAKTKKKRGREPDAAPADNDGELSGPGVYARPYRDELQALEKQDAQGLLEPKTPAHDRMVMLRYRATREAKVSARIHELLQQREALGREHEAAAARGDQDALQSLAEKAAAWNEECNVLTPNTRNELLLFRDNHHLFRQQPPVLAWDRRAVEPLVARGTEFFPNAPCALLDIQPKAMHPLLRIGRPDKSGDMFELILRGMAAVGAEPVSKAIDAVWPGAAEGVLPHCPSLRDRSRGGHPIGGPYSELSARTLNETQWTEIMNAWMKWPFRPTLAQLVSRISDESDPDPDDDLV